MDYWKTGTYFPITVSVYDDNDKKLHGDYPTVTLQALAESTSSSSAPRVYSTLCAIARHSRRGPRTFRTVAFLVGNVDARPMRGVFQGVSGLRSLDRGTFGLISAGAG